MNIRITGIPDDAIVLVCDPRFFTTRVDEPYPDRGDSRLARFYIEMQMPPDDRAVP